MFLFIFLFHSITLSTTVGVGTAGAVTGSGTGSANGDTNAEIDIKTEMSSTNDSLALVSSATTINNATSVSAMECTDIVATDDEFSKEQPDADTIKMFVGQVPKAWDEMKLRTLFEQYGRVHTLNVLRDKVTMMSRGKC